MERGPLNTCPFFATTSSVRTAVRAGTHYPHVTWAHVMLRVQVGCERRFNIEFYDADSHFCHSAYVTWSHVDLWSAHAPTRLSHFCCRTHFVRRDQRVECSASRNVCDTLPLLVWTASPVRTFWILNCLIWFDFYVDGYIRRINSWNLQFMLSSVEAPPVVRSGDPGRLQSFKFNTCLTVHH